MQKKGREILLPRGAQIGIARLLGVGRAAVREACGGLTQSELAHRIREVAVTEFGGLERPE